MPLIDHYRHQFDYHFHTTLRLIAVAQDLGNAETQREPKFGRGGIFDLFVHVLAADRNWRIRLQSRQLPEPIGHLDSGDWPSVVDFMESERAAWAALFGGFKEADLDQEIELPGWDGRQFSIKPWQVIQHVLFHGMQHHSEIAWMLSQLGRSPGDIDFIYFEPEG